MEDFTGKIKLEEGEAWVELDSPLQYDCYLQSFENDEEVVVSVRKPEAHKTVEQRNYFHGCVVRPAALHFGYTEEEFKGVLKRRFLTENKGTKKEYVKDTESLPRKEYSQFIDHCVMDLAHYGFVVEPPTNHNKTGWYQK